MLSVDGYSYNFNISFNFILLICPAATILLSDLIFFFNECCLLLFLICCSDIPLMNNNSMWKVHLLLEALSIMTFGDFDEMIPLKNLNETMEDLNNINITGLLYKVNVIFYSY